MKASPGRSIFLPTTFGLTLFAAIVATLVSGCNNNSTPAATASPNPAQNCSSLTSNSGTISGTTLGTAQGLPALGLCTGSITFQAGTTNTGGTVAVSSSSVIPGAAPTFQPSNPIGTNSTGATLNPLLFETLQLPPGTTITIPSAAPAFSFTVAATTGCTNYYVVYGGVRTNPSTGPQAWQSPGPGVGANQSTVNIPSSTVSNVVLGSQTNATVYFLALACT